MEWGEWITLGAAICGPAGLIGFIMLLPQIRNLQAGTTKIEKDGVLVDITGATTLSAAALAQMQAAIQQVDRLEPRVRTLEREIEAHREMAMAHMDWDRTVVARLRDLGITDMPAPPPLLPPHKQEVSK